MTVIVELFGAAFISYTPDAKVDLFSAGGDVNIWNNYGNVGLLQWRGSFMQPQHYFVKGGHPRCFDWRRSIDRYGRRP